MVERWIADSGLSERYPIYTRANVGEVFPDPVTPLTRDSGIWLAELGWRDAWERVGAFDHGEFDPDEIEQLGIAGGYCYLNASLIRLFGERAPGLSAQAMDEQFFGTQPGIPPYVEQPGDVDLNKTERIGQTFGWALTTEDLPELIDDQIATKKLRDDRPDLSALTDRELADRYFHLMDSHFRDLFAHHIFISYMATLPVGILSAMAAAVGDPSLVMRLIVGLGHVDSAAPSMVMWDMGRVVAESPALTAEFDKGLDGLHERLRESVDEAAVKLCTMLDEFVYEFGSRGPNEWEMRSPTWETKPNLALAAVDRMRLSPESAAPIAQNLRMASDREELVAELTRALEGDPATQGQFLAAVRAAQVFLPGRERTKTNNIRMLHEARMTMRELGRRMVERGAFDEIEDFGMLRKAEYDDFLADPHAYTEAIRSRRAQYDELSALDPPFVFVGEPDFPAAWTPRSANNVAQLKSGDTLAGLSGCPGVAEGRARVILDSHDPTALEPGDVLVAPITDPSWTPLFVPACAVVVDVGALQSHAVIVSRELGIPCVVSATGATRAIPDGARVRVDGLAGTVTVL
jgi:rifampicin phosphotransferase